MNSALRAPHAADFDALASWIPDAEVCKRWAGPKLRFPFAAAELSGLLQVEQLPSFALTAEGDELLGFGQFWPRGEGVAHLGRIIIAPRRRGLGLGASLCRRLIAEAQRAMKAAKVTLRVYRDNPAACATYLKLGFVVVEAESDAGVLTMEIDPHQVTRPAVTRDL